MIMETRTINLSYDIPVKIKGTDKDNDLTKKDLVKELIELGGIELPYVFSIKHSGETFREEEIVCPVQSTIIFASTKSLKELEQILLNHEDRLYFVLTEVKEDVDDYIARVMIDYEEQDKFNDTLKTIKKELSDKQR